MFDRRGAVGPASNGTLGFIQFLAGPFFDKCTARLRGTHAMAHNLKHNQARWERRRARFERDSEKRE